MPIQETELTKQIKALEELKAEALKLEQSIINRRPSELAGLPEAYGFKSLNDFIKAVKAAYGKGGKRKVVKAAAPKSGKRGRPAKAAAPKKEKKARTRARITDEIKAQVKALVEEGKSGSQIAKAIGISLPSVQNIKKAFGLVKSKAAAAPAAAPAAETPAS